MNVNEIDSKLRALLEQHCLAYSAGHDAAEVFPHTTTDDWLSCGDNGADCQNRVGLTGMLAGLKQAVPDVRWEIMDVLVSGEQVVVRGRGTGTPAVDFMGVPPTGKSFHVMSIDIHTLRDGKIAHTHHLEDWLGAIGQLTTG